MRGPHGQAPGAFSAYKRPNRIATLSYIHLQVAELELPKSLHRPGAKLLTQAQDIRTDTIKRRRLFDTGLVHGSSALLLARRTTVGPFGSQTKKQQLLTWITFWV